MTTAQHGGASVEPSDWHPREDVYTGGLRDPRWVGETARLRESCPVAYAEECGGFYTLTRYADVERAALDYKSFASGQQFVRIPSLFTVPGSLNPPEHTVFRRLLNQYFTPVRMAAMGPAITATARDLLRRIVERGRGDLVGEYCQPLAARGLATLLSLGDHAYEDMLANFAQFDALGWEPGAVNQLLVNLFREHIQRLIAERRQDARDPETDVLAGVMSMEVDGRPLTDEQVIAIGVGLIGAGHSTVADALSSAAFRLATDPYLQSRLRRQPELIPDAIEEMLRLDAPLPERSRRAVNDIEIGGRTIPAGSLVALNYGAANLDEGQFPHPEACIVGRAPNRHLGFGAGVHKCLGAPLARLEMKIALSELLAGTARFQLSAGPENGKGLVLKGFAHVPVHISPAPSGGDQVSATERAPSRRNSTR